MNTFLIAWNYKVRKGSMWIIVAILKWIGILIGAMIGLCL